MLGRGIQKLTENGPWVPTPALEVCNNNENFSHLPIAVPADDASPASVIGGGELNLLAGATLWRKYKPKLTVCAYGERSNYLRSIDAPSESEVMSQQLQKLIPEAKIETWPRTRTIPGKPSNTNQELWNVMNLARERGLREIGVVTVTVHLPRTIFFAKNHLSLPEFTPLELQYFASGLVLVEKDPKLFAEDMIRIYSSLSFGRNAGLEARGIKAVLDGTYKPIAG